MRFMEKSFGKLILSCYTILCAFFFFPEKSKLLLQNKCLFLKAILLHENKVMPLQQTFTGDFMPLNTIELRPEKIFRIRNSQ